jgi:hypothetical protein
VKKLEREREEDKDSEIWIRHDYHLLEEQCRTSVASGHLNHRSVR